MMDIGFVGNAQRVDKIFGEQMQSMRPKQLHPNTEARLVDFMQKRTADFVKLILDPSASKLKFIREKRGVGLFEGVNHKQQYMVKAVTTVNASVEDVLNNFQMSNTWDIDATMHKFFDMYANKAATVANASCRPIHVHWMSLNTEKIESRDVVFASQSQFYEHADEGLYPLPLNSQAEATAGSLVWESVDLAKEIPLLRHTTTGCTRYFFRHCGFFVEQTNEVEVSKVSFALSLDNEAGSVGGSKWMHQLALSLENLARALRRIELIPKERWVHRDHCGLCQKTFRAFRRRHHCRLCGECICGDCSKTMQLDSPVVDHGQLIEISQLRSCIKCFDSNSNSSQRSQSSASEFSKSFDEPRPLGRSTTISSSSNITQSLSSERSYMYSETKLKTVDSHSVSAHDLNALDDLLGTSVDSMNIKSVTESTTRSSREFVNTNRVPAKTSPVVETEHESRSSNHSEVYVLDDDNGFDISAPTKRPVTTSSSSESEIPVQPTSDFVVFDTNEPLKVSAATSDMIKLKL
ncbi:hypothetical protein THRCLA_22744 [Thraustotheca clavata]|uniref:FYVE-type domain-containing protein n=1 Tax=Thraustotheca clavata TaxID=74557 RepID=A0A1V9YTL7_9STRA|nr:hypothetical protein THRCLA_22744 [Thraustotheca clavata]